MIQKTSELLRVLGGKIQDIKDQIDSIRQESQERKVSKAKKDILGTVARNATPTPVELVITLRGVMKATVAVGLVVLLAYVLFLLQGIIGMLLMAFFLAAILNPFVDFLEKKHIPRAFGVLISYVLVLVGVTVVVMTIIPLLKTEFEKMFQQLLGFLRHAATEEVTSLPVPLPFVSTETKQWLIHQANIFKENINIDLIYTQFAGWLDKNQEILQGQLQGIATNFLGVLSAVTNGLGNIILILLLTFFIIIDRVTIKAFFLTLLPRVYRSYFSEKITTIQTKIGAWVKGQMMLNVVIGLSTYVGFWILHLFGLGIPHKGTLAVIAGITEMIPVVGPIIAAIFAVLVAANIGWGHVLGIIVLFLIIQQLENNMLVPVIMRHAVGLNSIVIIIGMIVGTQFFGFLGLLLAVPVCTIISLFVHDYVENNARN